ncbi:MAG: hypothetical protein JWR40_1792 [Massilia sp.]|jgi:GGDEF domain-containing protein|nr:hypothetical protein [Massilia sp.]
MKPGARVGIALITGRACDPDDLVRHADIALNRASSWRTACA